MIHKVHEPHGTLELVNYSADDLMVVNAARVSFAKQSELENGKLSEADAGLVGFLLKHKHGTPFEQNYFQFRVRAPIFVMREWHRHRIGISINEESGRYVELRGDFYLPDDDHVRVQKGKPGHYTYVTCGSEAIPDEKWNGDVVCDTYGAETRASLEFAYEEAYRQYEHLLSLGVAKEIARACLPVSIYSEMLWSCNARSLMAFLALRNHDRALREIRDYAAVMEDIFADVMPVTHRAFVDNGRTAP